MEMLFSTPSAELPDVYLSESVLFASECVLNAQGKCTVTDSPNSVKSYTVVLTHPPGMREDETVRVYAYHAASEFPARSAAWARLTWARQGREGCGGMGQG